MLVTSLVCIQCTSHVRNAREIEVEGRGFNFRHRNLIVKRLSLVLNLFSLTMRTTLNNINSVDKNRLLKCLKGRS